MDRVWTPLGMLFGGLLAATGCVTTDTLGGPDAPPPCSMSTALAPSAAQNPPDPQTLPAIPTIGPEARPLPINLPAALQLANVQAVDIAAAAERIRVAASLLEQAEVLWLPTITVGGDYNRHDGRNQDALGTVFDNSRSSGMLGLGTGIGPAAVIDIGEAIFAPLAARQQVRARQADRQATSNDMLVSVSDAYFTVQQARGELAGAQATTQRMEDLVRRTKKLAPAVVPEFETDRAEAELARRQQAELSARERWKVAGAELMRLLRMDPSAQVEPQEPPHLRVELIDLHKPVDDLVPIALTSRPELASQQAQVQLTLTLLRQEQLRPLIPSLLLRGYSTPVTGTLGAGYFGGGTNGFFGNGGLREDFDVQLLWQFNNLGFGNRAQNHRREADNRLAVIELFRIQDRIAAEVVQAHTQAQMATKRVEVAEKGVRSALNSADKNLLALGQTKGAGNQMVLLVRPQEAVAAVQGLAQAYVDYYGAVADANRAQFRLYRALGQPAQCLVQEQRTPTLCPPGVQLPEKLPRAASENHLPASASPAETIQNNNVAPRQ
jgi:outer membrane protein TolC